MDGSEDEEDEAWDRSHREGVAAELAAANTPASSAIVVFTPGNLSPPEEPVPEPSELDVDAQAIMRLCEDQAQVLQIYLIQSGLVGSLLALQKGDESELLLQVMKDCDLPLSSQLQFDTLLDLVRQLVDSALEQEPMAKRRRGLHLPLAQQQLLDAAVFVEPVPARVTTALDLMIIPKRGTRKALRSTDQSVRDIGDRQLQEEKLLQFWTNRVVALLKEGETPSYKLALQARDPASVMMLMAGKTRCSTLRKYVKAWERFRRWLLMEGPSAWPTGPLQIIEYLQTLAAEPCGATIPQTFIQAAAWLEKAGGYDDYEKLSCNALVTRCLDKINTILTAGARPTKQSPRFPCIVLASAELFVVNPKHSTFLRYSAWLLLLKCWSSLRHDDLQHITPRNLRMVEGALLGTLSQSKTSGPGKRMRELPVVVSRSCKLCCTQWLSVGFDLMKELLPGDKIDFMIPRGTMKGLSSTHIPASYSDASAAEHRLFMELKVPGYDTIMGWSESATALFPIPIIGFWTLHSPRNFVSSLLIFLDVEKSKRDMVGRWSPSGSEDYTRTYRAAVAKLQAAVVAALHNGAGLSTMQEGDTVELLPEFLQERRGLPAPLAEQMVREWEQLMKDFHFALQGAESDNCAGLTSVEVPLLSKALAQEDLELADAEKAPVGDFLVIFTRGRRYARLHRFGACHWSFIEVHDALRMETVSPVLYNSRCKFCWPATKESVSSEGSQEETSEASA